MFKNRTDKDAVIQSQLARLRENEVQMSVKAKELLDLVTSLSGFDVGMKLMGDRLKDFTSELSELSETNLAMIEETTTNMSQANGYIDETTSTLQSLAEEVSRLSSQNKESSQLLQEVHELKDNVIKDNEIMNEQISQLVSLTSEVDKIVESVQGIASQTNLLALNASIEAARAGEHGRGFAVVADEVRDLADSTKQNLEGMQSVVRDIGKAAEAGKISLERSSKMSDEMGQKINQVTATMSTNMEMLKGVTQSVEKISRTTEGIRQSASDIETALEEAVDGADHLSSMTRTIQEEADQTVSYADKIVSFDDELSDFSREMYQELLGTERSITNEELQEVIGKAVEAHKEWISNLNKMVDEMTLLPIQLNAKKCRFGHFYYAIDLKNPKLASEWKEIDKYHQKLHSYGDTVSHCIKNKDQEGARRAYEDAVEVSDKLVGVLDRVNETIKQMTANGEKIFE